MNLDSILAHIPAWREFFIEPWSAIAMTPEKHTEANQLEEQHRKLMLELKQWQGQAEAPAMMTGGYAMTQATPIPVELWVAFKAGMVKHLQALIAKNREAFDAL